MAAVIENKSENADEKQFRYYKRTDADIKKLIELYNQGKKMADIADMFRIPKEKVKNKIFDLKRSDKWKKCFPGRENILEAEAPAEPVTTLEERESSPIKDHINDLKVHFADFVIDECRREEVPSVVELVGAYLKYLEKKVNSNE